MDFIGFDPGKVSSRVCVITEGGGPGGELLLDGPFASSTMRDAASLSATLSATGLAFRA